MSFVWASNVSPNERYGPDKKIALLFSVALNLPEWPVVNIMTNLQVISKLWVKYELPLFHHKKDVDRTRFHKQTDERMDKVIPIYPQLHLCGWGGLKECHNHYDISSLFSQFNKTGWYPAQTGEFTIYTLMTQC